MRYSLIFILLITSQLSFANMASPWDWGTIGATAFSSKNIDILKEELIVKIDKDFKTALYKIKYYLKSDKEGYQIPLLFVAKDYKDYFKVWIDGLEIKLSSLPTSCMKVSQFPFLQDFSNSVNLPSREGESETVVIWDTENSGSVYTISDLKYFLVNLTKGEHCIQVEYVANRSQLKFQGELKIEYFFIYSLSPAKYWRSFGNLEITLDATAFHKNLITNIGHPNSGKLDSIAVWNFNKLPTEYFQISYYSLISKPKLIKIEFLKVTIITGFIIALFLILGIIYLKRKKPKGKYFLYIEILSAMIPMFVIIFCFALSWKINKNIGLEVSQDNNYIIFIGLGYLLLMQIYWAIRLLFYIIKNKKNVL